MNHLSADPVMSVLIEKLPNGHEALLAGQKSGVVYALDPDRKGALDRRARPHRLEPAIEMRKLR